MRIALRESRVTGPCAMLCVFALLAFSGCMRWPYRYGGKYLVENDVPLKPDESQFERGRRAPIIDGVGWVVGLPAKIVMLNHRMDNHNVSPETESSLQEYLADNDLDKVKVRVNQYDPCGEWQRMHHNKSISWPLRYTIGTLSVVGYTVLPGRVWGGDNYNPFTNTISIYSDVPAAALYEGAHAKDYAQREYKGLYAVASIVPGVGVWQNSEAAGDAMEYIKENGNAEETKDGYRTIYPQFALRSASPFAINGLPLVLPALVGGHALGQVKAAGVSHEATPGKSETATQNASHAELPLTACSNTNSSLQ